MRLSPQRVLSLPADALHSADLSSPLSQAVRGYLRVDEMVGNLIPPPRIMPIQGLVINEPESGIFFMNMNTNIGFQRESEFHLTNPGGLRDCYGDVFSNMNYVIEARSDCIKSNIRRIQVTDIVKEVNDYLKTRSSAGMDMSWFLNDGEGDSSEFMLLAMVNWNNAGDGEIVDQQINNDVGNGVLDQDLGENLVINQAKRLGLFPPPELATFGLTAEEKKKKRTELIK
nr:hypothetical protein [Tanacetum cinerariifolium]